MIVKIELTEFYSEEDERRLFQGLHENPAIISVQGMGPNLLLNIKLALLVKIQCENLLHYCAAMIYHLSPCVFLRNARNFLG